MVTLADLAEFKKHTATELRMTAGDKRKLMDEITQLLGIGGWSCPGPDGRATWDVTNEDQPGETVLRGRVDCHQLH